MDLCCGGPIGSQQAPRNEAFAHGCSSSTFSESHRNSRKRRFPLQLQLEGDLIFYGELIFTQDFACSCVVAHPRPIRYYPPHRVLVTAPSRHFHRARLRLFALRIPSANIGGKIFLPPAARWKEGSEVEAWRMVGCRRHVWK